MGIYVFDAPFLYSELLRDADDSSSSHDFGRDIIPSLVTRGGVVFIGAATDERSPMTTMLTPELSEQALESFAFDVDS